METPEELAKFFIDGLTPTWSGNNPQLVKRLTDIIADRDAAIRTECAERALVFYCQEVCFEDDENENAICRKRGGCKWANQLRAAIMGK